MKLLKCFILAGLIVILGAGCGSINNEFEPSSNPIIDTAKQEEDEKRAKEEAEKKAKEEAEVKNAAEKKAKEEAELLAKAKEEAEKAALPENKIKSKVEEVVGKLSNTTLTDVQVNENLGTDEENDFITLVYLSFDVKNPAKTAKKMLDLYNNEIGANMASLDINTELVLFWKVPYLNDKDNIAKANLTKKDGNYYFEEKWFDSNIFD